MIEGVVRMEEALAKCIFIATDGSRGDVEPFIALSIALKNAGYYVTLAAPPDYGDWIRSSGVAHHSIGDPALEWMDVIADAIENDRSMREVESRYEKRFRKLFDDLYPASAGAGLLIYAPLVISAVSIAEARRIPAVCASLQPVCPTADFGSPLLRRYTYGRILNRASHWLVDFFIRKTVRPWINGHCRRSLGLAPLGRFHDIRAVGGKPAPLMLAVSEALIPRPKDWPPHAHMTGLWLLKGDAGWCPSPELAAFLRAGAPPIYIGFGSIPLGQSKTAPGLLLEALRMSGQRAVIARGWGRWNNELLTQGSAKIHIMDSAPHRQLFPLMAGVVHHGGAGTTAAALLAGCPSLVTPLELDQFFWGNLVARHGAGPRPLPVKQWRAETLAERMVELTGVASYGEKARELSARMKRENGVARAVEVVQSVIGSP